MKFGIKHLWGSTWQIDVAQMVPNAPPKLPKQLISLFAPLHLMGKALNLICRLSGVSCRLSGAHSTYKTPLNLH